MNPYVSRMLIWFDTVLTLHSTVSLILSFWCNYLSLVKLLLDFWNLFPRHRTKIEHTKDVHKTPWIFSERLRNWNFRYYRYGNPLTINQLFELFKVFELSNYAAGFSISRGDLAWMGSNFTDQLGNLIEK